jgi:hypothetical protein
LNIADIQAAVQALTYKPGYTITLHIPQAERYIMFSISHTAMDVTDPSKTVFLQWKAGAVPENFRNAHDVHMQVYELMRQMEEHEMQEWLRADGKEVVEPVHHR